MKKTFSYLIISPDEPAAGIRGFRDEITVTVASGDPGGEPEEFDQQVIEFLREWYDGARVKKTERKKRRTNKLALPILND